MDHAFDLEGGERPVDRRARRFAGIAFAPGLPCDAPADLEIRPGGRKPGAYSSDELAAMPFLDREHSRPVDGPMPGHDNRMPPARHGVLNGLAVDGDESRGGGI